MQGNSGRMRPFTSGSLSGWLLGGVILIACYGAIQASGAEFSDGAALQRRLQALLVEKNQRAADPVFLVRLADLYLDLGDDESQDEPHRRSAYEEGAKLAKQSLQLDEHNAHAHYLYAANLGSAARLEGVTASALTVQELKRHVRRALELNPNHAAALHMMGMMLEELPWVLGGDREAAVTYLRRSVAVDPSYAHARLDLAKVYVKRKEWDLARAELDTLIGRPLPPDASAGDRRHRDEALHLRHTLNNR